MHMWDATHSPFEDGRARAIQFRSLQDAKSFETSYTASVSDEIAVDSAQFSDEPTLEQLRRKQNAFARERNWDQYHTPRNLMLALTGEVGELAGT